MSAALPCAGGTYNYAKRGLNRVWANMAGWHYIVSVVAIGAGETLAFANYFKILMEQLGISIVKLDSRIIAIILVAVFLISEVLSSQVRHRQHLCFSSGAVQCAGSFI